MTIVGNDAALSQPAHSLGGGAILGEAVVDVGDRLILENSAEGFGLILMRFEGVGGAGEVAVEGKFGAVGDDLVVLLLVDDEAAAGGHGVDVVGNAVGFHGQRRVEVIKRRGVVIVARGVEGEVGDAAVLHGSQLMKHGYAEGTENELQLGEEQVVVRNRGVVIEGKGTEIGSSSDGEGVPPDVLDLEAVAAVPDGGSQVEAEIIDIRAALDKGGESLTVGFCPCEGLEVAFGGKNGGEEGELFIFLLIVGVDDRLTGKLDCICTEEEDGCCCDRCLRQIAGTDEEDIFSGEGVQLGGGDGGGADAHIGSQSRNVGGGVILAGCVERRFAVGINEITNGHNLYLLSGLKRYSVIFSMVFSIFY